MRIVIALFGLLALTATASARYVCDSVDSDCWEDYTCSSGTQCCHKRGTCTGRSMIENNGVDCTWDNDKSSKSAGACDRDGPTPDDDNSSVTKWEDDCTGGVDNFKTNPICMNIEGCAKDATSYWNTLSCRNAVLAQKRHHAVTGHWGWNRNENHVAWAAHWWVNILQGSSHRMKYVINGVKMMAVSATTTHIYFDVLDRDGNPKNNCEVLLYHWDQHKDHEAQRITLDANSSPMAHAIVGNADNSKARLVGCRGDDSDYEQAEYATGMRRIPHPNAPNLADPKPPGFTWYMQWQEQ